ncbi:hypothetical protein F442_17970 [Phytophthora nicotianae P10297]|uniref:Uncharacterized protein n=3 Tax=Phytophthora nicotianae TaxID=4792 RepID=V9E906_PHYNI|nr:hypothetical protein F443_18097 [Phytophthora nicotianae P1569]ETL29226.1 hypothetical protein L916_17538 [Phytophthora nicotianae]ETL82449.1 hypothetical protein L917_17380 [Phytophthora nicotianae]ETM35686.1 hypothetical protein L914_17439 [Phytophthora nicotianae]ETP33500.1 hypothetical protein F442_17970 [Phytophthora nicotianae P10297]
MQRSEGLHDAVDFVSSEGSDEMLRQVAPAGQASQFWL